MILVFIRQPFRHRKAEIQSGRSSQCLVVCRNARQGFVSCRHEIVIADALRIRLLLPVAEQVEVGCGAVAEQVEVGCGAVAEQVEVGCGAVAEQVEVGCGAVAEQVEVGCGAVAEQVEVGCGAVAEQVEVGCGAVAEQVGGRVLAVAEQVGGRVLAVAEQVRVWLGRIVGDLRVSDVVRDLRVSGVVGDLGVSDVVRDLRVSGIIRYLGMDRIGHIVWYFDVWCSHDQPICACKTSAVLFVARVLHADTWWQPLLNDPLDHGVGPQSKNQVHQLDSQFLQFRKACKARYQNLSLVVVKSKNKSSVSR